MKTNELKKIIENARITNLTKLSLSYNRLTSLPEELGNLTNLKIYR